MTARSKAPGFQALLRACPACLGGDAYFWGDIFLSLHHTHNSTALQSSREQDSTKMLCLHSLGTPSPVLQVGFPLWPCLWGCPQHPAAG